MPSAEPMARVDTPSVAPPTRTTLCRQPTFTCARGLSLVIRLAERLATAASDAHTVRCERQPDDVRARSVGIGTHRPRTVHPDRLTEDQARDLVDQARCERWR
jgi:hypothetical protein